MATPPVIPPVIDDNTTEQNKIVSPYFKEGLFAGVRVTTDDEDFVIAPEDYRNGELMTWNYAISALNRDNLITWNRHQLDIVMQYHNIINQVLINYDKAKLDGFYWTCNCSPLDLDYAYYGYFANGSSYITETDRWSSCAVRSIKDLKIHKY